MRLRTSVLVMVTVLLASLVPAAAQDYVRVDGTVQRLFGPTMTVISDTPGTPIYQMQGQYLVPVPTRQIFTIDLSQLPQTDYAFMRTGERITVIGVMAGESRVTATSLIRGQ
jgi:hypothetical protein